MRVLRVVLINVLASGLLVSLAVVCTAASFRSSDQILGNVWVQGVNVGGLSVAEARQALEQQAQVAVDRPVVLTHADQRFDMTIRELGGSADVDAALEQALAIGRDQEMTVAIGARVATLRDGRDVVLPIDFDDAKAKARLGQVAKELNRQAVNAGVELDGVAVKVKPEVTSWALDIARSLERARHTFGEAFVGEEMPLIVAEKAPTLTAAMLAKYQVLGHFSTRFNPGQVNRTVNLHLSVEACNNAVTPPGGVFSLNQTTGLRSPAKGYKLAPVYSGRETIMGYGGGVCQVSTTVYNAAVTAGQKIIERHSHSHAVPYVPWGRDATVSWGAADMRFQNVTSAPLILKMWIEGNSMNATLLGVPDRLPDEQLLAALGEAPPPVEESEDDGTPLIPRLLGLPVF